MLEKTQKILKQKKKNIHNTLVTVESPSIDMEMPFLN
jgi:hypothetical protein